MGSLLKVTEKLNESKQEDKKYKQSDITVIIDSKPMEDELHKHVRKIYRTNKKNGNEKKRTF